MKNLIIRILASFPGYIIFIFYLKYYDVPLPENELLDIMALAIIFISSMAIVFKDWSKGRKISEMIGSNIYLFVFAVLLSLFCAKVILLQVGLLTMFVTICMISPLALTFLDWYNGYNFSSIIKRAYAGIIVNIIFTFLALIMMHSADPRMFFILMPVVSATISEFVSGKNKSDINLFFVSIFFIFIFFLITFFIGVLR